MRSRARRPVRVASGAGWVSARAALADAREILDLCALAKLPELAPGLIRRRATLAEARRALLDARAGADEALHVDAHPPGNARAPAPPRDQAVRTASIWSHRRAQRA